MLLTFDQRLLDKFERFSHWWQKTFGQDCFWLARMAAILFSLSLLVFVISEIWWRKPNGKIGAELWLLEWIPGYLLFSWIEQVDKKVHKMHIRSLANQLKMELIYIRIFLLFTVPIYIAATFYVLSTTAPYVPIIYRLIGAHFYLWLIPTFYFISCDPLPPAKSKVRKWLESFTTAIKRFFALPPQPAPVRIPSR